MCQYAPSAGRRSSPRSTRWLRRAERSARFVAPARPVFSRTPSTATIRSPTLKRLKPDANSRKSSSDAASTRGRAMTSPSSSTYFSSDHAEPTRTRTRDLQGSSCLTRQALPHGGMRRYGHLVDLAMVRRRCRSSADRLARVPQLQRGRWCGMQDDKTGGNGNVGSARPLQTTCTRHVYSPRVLATCTHHVYSPNSRIA